ncbi:unnamed protein product [Dracunculus medinensis]|uniref:PDZ domain-containing protein n=1 Tax=Dracunculus medinensis TaxID=318479 RepID=A0A0N4UPU4_DRAME|nr:unnamed protein product [Dracunculus medinensis]
MHHVEHLLYYGADINAQNINGNTPLHVCAVNSRSDCARVLLFRGCDPTIVNKQGQTALHVARIVGNMGVAEMIQEHNPANAGIVMPYRGMPAYNTKRRLPATIVRRRSMSQNSIYSSTSEYRTPTPYVMSQQAMLPSPTPSRATLAEVPITQGLNDYDTIRRYSKFTAMDESDQISRISFFIRQKRIYSRFYVEIYRLNIPRILVIPRGPKGFGFIIRGAKRADANNFVPNNLMPALQFFEGVDMSGMAIKAGLRPGDFLLQINGVDVRTASHDEVVRLIQASGDTITLKVISHF